MKCNSKQFFLGALTLFSFSANASLPAWQCERICVCQNKKQIERCGTECLEYINASSEVRKCILVHYQIPGVLETIKSIKNPKLLLGVNKKEELTGEGYTDEHNLKNRLGESYDDYIFLDLIQDDPLDKRCLSVDLNDLKQLQMLAKKLEGVFEEIVLDDSTFKYTEWTAEHLSAFRQMLKIGGRFIFAPGYSSIIYDKDSDETSLDKLNDLDGKKLLKHLVDSKKNLSKYIENINDLKKIQKSFFLSEVVPRNYIRITDEAFGKDNVTIEYNKSLPIKSNYKKEQEVLITAIRND